jgi:hypothetical protein
VTMKDYINIAAAVRNASHPKDGPPDEYWVAEGMRAKVAKELADVMAADNPRFKRDVFLGACGLSLSVQ